MKNERLDRVLAKVAKARKELKCEMERLNKLGLSTKGLMWADNTLSVAEQITLIEQT